MGALSGLVTFSGHVRSCSNIRISLLLFCCLCLVDGMFTSASVDTKLDIELITTCWKQIWHNNEGVCDMQTLHLFTPSSGIELKQVCAKWCSIHPWWNEVICDMQRLHWPWYLIKQVCAKMVQHPIKTKPGKSGKLVDLYRHPHSQVDMNKLWRWAQTSLR